MGDFRKTYPVHTDFKRKKFLQWNSKEIPTLPFWLETSCFRRIFLASYFRLTPEIGVLVCKVVNIKKGMKTEHFKQSLSSQKTRSDVSEHQDFKIFRRSMFPTPLVACAFGDWVIHQCRLKKLPILHTQKGWTLWKRKQGIWHLAWNTVLFTPCYHCHA